MENAISVGISAASALLLRGMAKIDINKLGGVDFLRATLKAAGKPAAIVGADEHAIICNQAMEEFLGYKEAELRRMPFSEFTVRKYIESDRQHFHELLKGELDRYAMTKAWERRDGTQATGDMTVYPITIDGVISASYVTVDPQGTSSAPIQKLTDQVAPLGNMKGNTWISLIRELGLIQHKGKFAVAFFFVMLSMWLFAGGGMELLLDKFFK